MCLFFVVSKVTDRFLIKVIVEFGISFILVFDSFGKLGNHIVILGLELVFDGTVDFISKYKNNGID